MKTAELIVKTSPRWRGLTPTGKPMDNGQLEPGNPVIINCHHAQQGLCESCTVLFLDVLHDIPELLDDLDIAISGQVKFVERGQRPDATDAGNGHNGAVAAQQRLELALRGDKSDAHPGAADWFDARDPWFIAAGLASHLHRLAGELRMPQLARDISQAASRAHKVIDAPTQLFYYGPCPDCGEDILQERVHHTDTDTMIKCRYLSCGYAQPVDIHQQTILNGCLDLWMTVKEMVGVFDLGGVTVTRDQINGWIRRGRLTKGPGAAEWRNGVLVVAEEGAATYRVRDVLPLAQAANEKRRNTNLHPK